MCVCVCGGGGGGGVGGRGRGCIREGVISMSFDIYTQSIISLSPLFV